MSVQLSVAIIRLSEGQQPNLYSGSINSWPNRPKRPQMTSKVGQKMGEKEKYGNVKKEIIIQSIPHYLSSMIETMLRQVWLPVDPGHECLLMM